MFDELKDEIDLIQAFRLHKEQFLFLSKIRLNSRMDNRMYGCCDIELKNNDIISWEILIGFYIDAKIENGFDISASAMERCNGILGESFLWTLKSEHFIAGLLLLDRKLNNYMISTYNYI